MTIIGGKVGNKMQQQNIGRWDPGTLLLSRACAYALFHVLFGGLPDRQLLEIFSAPITSQVFDLPSATDAGMAQLKEHISSIAHNARQSDFSEKISNEFTVNFLGPGALTAYPWQSVYVNRSKLLFQTNTLAVRRAYAQQNLRLTESHGSSDDHISTMCCFLSLMSRATLDALEKGDPGKAQSLILDQNSFIRTHMLNWLPQYAQASLRCTTRYFYPQFMSGIASFCSLDTTLLSALYQSCTQQERIGGPETHSLQLHANFLRLWEQLERLDLPGLREYKLKGYSPNS